MKNKIGFIFGLMLFLAVCQHSIAANWQAKTDPGGLSYQIYVPDSYSKDVSDKRALMVIYSGCLQSNLPFTNNSGNAANLEEVADKWGMAIAVPARNFAVEAGASCWAYWQDFMSSPEKFQAALSQSKALITNLSGDESLAIDKNQIYVTGLSSGAALAQSIGCAAPDLIAGVSSSAGPTVGSKMSCSLGSFCPIINRMQYSTDCETLAGDKTSDFQTQIAAIAFGDKDGTVNTQYGMQNAQMFADIYTEFSEDPVSQLEMISQLDGGNGATEQLWSDNRVSLVKFNGVGHAWAAGDGAIATPGLYGNYIDNSSINYGEYLAKFFTENNMRIDTHDFNPPKISDLVVEGTYSIAIGGKIHISANINDDVEVQKVELTLTNENGVIVESRKARLRYPVDYIDAETDGCGTNCGVADPFAGSVYIEETFDALPVGKFKVAIIATDNKGLLGKKSREVLLEDTNSPVIGYISTSYAKYPYTYLFPKSDEFIAGKTFTVSGEITDDVMVKSAVVIIRNSGGEIVKKTDAKLNYLQEECCCEGDNCGCAISPPDERRAYFKEKFTLETLGVYTVEVTSTDNEGLTDKKTKNITIIEDNTLQIDRVQIDVVSNGSAIKVFAEISDDIRVESANLTLKDSQGQVVDSIVANVQFYMESGCEEYPDGSFNCDGSPLYTDAYIKETFTDVLPGSYTLEIVATDNEGHTDREIKAITILEISDFNVVYNKEEKSIAVAGSVFCDDCENVRVTIDLYYGDLVEVIEDVDTMLVENGQHGFRLDFSGVSYRKGAGRYYITATAIAKDGTRSTKTKIVFLDYENVAPKFNSFSVSAPSVSGSFNVTGEVTDPDEYHISVGLVIKTLDGTVIKSLADLNLEKITHGGADTGWGSIRRFNETIENIPPGEYIVEATVTDSDDATAVESVTIKIDGSSEAIPPEIEKLEVIVDSETGLVEVTGTAIDNNGARGGHVDAISLTLKSSGGEIIKQVDTLPAIICTTAEPGVCYYETADFSENFENVSNGSYSIEAVVTDIDGLTGSALKYFSVGQQIDTVDIEVKAVDTDTVFVENDAVLHEFTISNKGNIDANEVDVVIDIENGTLAAEQSDGCSKITSTRLKCTIDQLAYDSPEILEVAIIVNYIVGDDQFLKTTATATAKESDINPDNNSAYTANPIQDEPGTEGIKEEPKDGLGGSLDLLLAIIALLGLFGVRRRRK